jgi:hypothetical protein
LPRFTFSVLFVLLVENFLRTASFQSRQGCTRAQKS